MCISAPTVFASERLGSPGSPRKHREKQWNDVGVEFRFESIRRLFFEELLALKTGKVDLGIGHVNRKQSNTRRLTFFSWQHLGAILHFQVYVKPTGHDYNPGLVCVLPFWTFPESYRGPGKKVEKDTPGPKSKMHTDKNNIK